MDGTNWERTPAGQREPRRDRVAPLVDGVVGFVWAFIAALLVLAGGVVAGVAVGTHLLIRVRPGVTKVITYDPSTVAIVAVVPALVGLALGWLFWRRVRRGARSTV